MLTPIDRSATIPQQIQEMGRRARAACDRLVALDGGRRTAILRAMAEALRNAAPAIETANAEDVADGRTAGLAAAMLDRLTLTPARIEAMATGVEQVADLPDPLGEELRRIDHPDGLVIRKVRVPLGVIAMIYESRPNVTADAAALCFKAGNAVVLRGGSEAVRSNRIILETMVEAGTPLGLPADALQLVGTTDRAAVNELLQLEDDIDLVIPRGGEGLIRTVAEHSRVPVLKHYKGVCHVYVDAAADPAMARDIIVNAKCQRPGVCNAAETLLVHEAIASSFLPETAAALRAAGVELRVDGAAAAFIPDAVPATDADWGEEYLDLILTVGIVPDVDAAIAHVNRHGSHHSDVIVTADTEAAESFRQRVDSATVYVNASSRFTDGFEFGMGAEIGISTDKLHARGPCGVEELTTYKYVIEGSGQVRG